MANAINHEPHAKQVECLRALQTLSGYKVVGYGGSKGGGKSHLARMWLAMRALKYQKSTGLLIRKSYQELYRNHTRNFLSEYPMAVHAAQKNQIEFPNGSIIELAYCENERDLERFQGVEYHSVVIDQAEQHPKQVYYYLRSCMRSSIPGLAPKMLMTFNPGSIGHTWIKRMFIDRLPDENEDLDVVQFVQAQVYDNPHIDKEYVKSLETLPEQLKQAYLNGDFGAFDGQFFQEFGAHLAEEPFRMEQSQVEGRLFGSLDGGTTHATSFGLWYVDSKYTIHRLFTYFNNGLTHRDHALAISEAIESFPYTHGYFPEQIWADPALWTQVKLNEATVRSPIDEYMDVFSKKKTQIIKANNNKVNGCQMMRLLFKGADGLPAMRYWAGHNHSFVEGIAAAVSDKNNREIYLKMDGDDAVDESRYGLVGCYSFIGQLKQMAEARRAQTKVEQLIHGQRRTNVLSGADWYNL